MFFFFIGFLGVVVRLYFPDLESRYPIAVDAVARFLLSIFSSDISIGATLSGLEIIELICGWR